MFVTIPEDKQRLRDEAELAVMAWAEAGRSITRCERSRAPVCVPAPVAAVMGEVRVAAAAFLRLNA